MGRNHLLALKSLTRVPVIVFDSDSKRLEDLKDHHEIFSNISDLDKMKIAGVVIASPAHTHLDWANWAAQRSIPFLVEKPLGLTLHGWPELIRLTEDKGIPCGVAFPRRHSPAVKKIHGQIISGELGIPRIFSSNFSQDFRKYRPDYQNIYYARSNEGGGFLIDALSHHLNLAQYFMGEIEELRGFYDRLEFQNTECEDCGIIAVKFKNGSLGSCQGNQFQKPNTDFIEIVASLANVRYERVSGIYAQNSSDSVEWKTEQISGDWPSILSLQMKNFVEVTDGKGVFPTTLGEGCHLVEALNCLMQSTKELL